MKAFAHSTTETCVPGRGLARCENGSVFVEYAVLVAILGVPVALALTSVAAKTVKNYAEQRAALYQPSP